MVFSWNMFYQSFSIIVSFSFKQFYVIFIIKRITFYNLVHTLYQVRYQYFFQVENIAESENLILI